MKFNSSAAVREVIDNMENVEVTSGRAENRRKINDLMNGEAPLTNAEAEEYRQNTNVSFLEGTSIVHKARSTWNNAMLKPGNFFKVSLEDGPPHKKGAWGSIITSKISRRMKSSLRYVESVKATGAQVITHGPGPNWWCSPQRWCPEEIGIDDLLMPSGTRVNLSNLNHFAIRQQFTAGQLYRLTHGKHVDEGWNMAVVNRELRRIAENRGDSAMYDFRQPEKIAEFYRANAGIVDTDVVPTIDCWAFFYEDEKSEGVKWYKKILVSAPEDAEAEEGFLYNPKRPFAGDLSQILHIQFGDGANVAPFLYHSVRSLGYLIYAVCHLQNRLRCRFMDAIFEATLQYFKSVGADDRSKVEKIDLQHLGIIPEGLTMVPQAERWQVNEALVTAGLSQNRQLMAENASSFVQDTDNGTGKELTATEVMARLNSANALVSSLLSGAYNYEEFKYREIARRFTIKDSKDPDVASFRKECIAAGVPEKYLCLDYWNISVERVLGAGNKTLEITQARALQEIKSEFDPDAQREVLRNYVLAVTDDPALALRLVPEDKASTPPAAHDAELAMGSLMNLAPVGIRQGIDHISYVEAFLGSMLMIVQTLEKMQQGGELPSATQVLGLQAAAKHVEAHISIIAQDEDEQQRVKRYGDLLGKLMNLVKKYAQQLDAQREAQNQEKNGEAQAKIAATLMQAQTKAKVTEANAQQKGRHKEIQFQNDQARKNAQTSADVQRGNLKTVAEVQALDAKTAAQVRAKRETSKQETTSE